MDTTINQQVFLADKGPVVLLYDAAALGTFESDDDSLPALEAIPATTEIKMDPQKDDDACSVAPYDQVEAVEDLETTIRRTAQASKNLANEHHFNNSATLYRQRLMIQIALLSENCKDHQNDAYIHLLKRELEYAYSRAFA